MARSLSSRVFLKDVKKRGGGNGREHEKEKQKYFLFFFPPHVPYEWPERNAAATAEPPRIC